MMKSNEFRAELVKAMPGYKWTVHRPMDLQEESALSATGTQSAGFNRLSTLFVERRDRSGVIEYEVKSSGFGSQARWITVHRDSTLPRALRGLQNHYEGKARMYSGAASDLKYARKVE